jgi:chromosome segregation ATPase
MANNTQASKFVDEESKPPATAPKYVSSSHRQLLDVTDAEIDRCLDVLDEADRVTAPISGLRRVVTTTLSQLSWDLAEMRRLLQAFGSSEAAHAEAVSVREKLRADLHTLMQEQLDGAGRALRELQKASEGRNPRLESQLATSIVLLRRELKSAS